LQQHSDVWTERDMHFILAHQRRKCPHLSRLVRCPTLHCTVTPPNHGDSDEKIARIRAARLQMPTATRRVRRRHEEDILASDLHSNGTATRHEIVLETSLPLLLPYARISLLGLVFQCRRVGFCSFSAKCSLCLPYAVPHHPAPSVGMFKDNILALT
jgi:hypothetical protein